MKILNIREKTLKILNMRETSLKFLEIRENHFWVDVYAQFLDRFLGHR